MTMMGSPAYTLQPLNTITSYSEEALAYGIYAPDGSNTLASLSWGTKNHVRYWPFHLDVPRTAVKMFTMNGASVGGSGSTIDIGIYDSNNHLIVSSGGTAMSGTNAVQEFDITDTQIGPGDYFMAMGVTWPGTAPSFFTLFFADELFVPALACYFESTAGGALPATSTMLKEASGAGALTGRTYLIGVAFSTVI